MGSVLHWGWPVAGNMGMETGREQKVGSDLALEHHNMRIDVVIA